MVGRHGLELSHLPIGAKAAGRKGGNYLFATSLTTTAMTNAKRKLLTGFGFDPNFCISPKIVKPSKIKATIPTMPRLKFFTLRWKQPRPEFIYIQKQVRLICGL